MEGEAKRDYPASVSYQSPWWRDFAYAENHFARVNTAMTRGKPLAVGELAYDAILVPGCQTLRKTTLERLEAFRAQGGRLKPLGILSAPILEECGAVTGCK